MNHPNWRQGNGMWKGGRMTTNRGYRKVLVEGHPHSDRDGYVLEHRHVMEEKLGRYLKPEERVHHDNGDKLDNHIENLSLFKNHSEHIKTHNIKRGKDVKCETCSKVFYKRRGQLKITTLNFCSQKCINPGLWLKRRDT